MTKILVIEDEDSFRRVLVQMLGKAGYDVRQAGDGNQALEVCAVLSGFGAYRHHHAG